MALYIKHNIHLMNRNNRSDTIERFKNNIVLIKFTSKRVHQNRTFYRVTIW